MKKLIKETKWWWYIPVISIFFIEEQAEWVYKYTEIKKHDDYKAWIMMAILVMNAFSIALLLYTVKYGI